jgi:hypothetical protein
VAFKLRRLGRRARTIRSSGFGLPDDRDSVSVVLIAPHSPTGLTGDAATAVIVADALISHTLNTLRQQMGF